MTSEQVKLLLRLQAKLYTGSNVMRCHPSPADVTYIVRNRSQGKWLIAEPQSLRGLAARSNSLKRRDALLDAGTQSV